MPEPGDPPTSGDPYITCTACDGEGYVPKGQAQILTEVDEGYQRVKLATANLHRAWAHHNKSPNRDEEREKALQALNDATAELMGLWEKRDLQLAAP